MLRMLVCSVEEHAKPRVYVMVTPTALLPATEYGFHVAYCAFPQPMLEPDTAHTPFSGLQYPGAV